MRKRSKAALKFILNNEIIVRKLSEAVGCDGAASIKDRKIIIKDMISMYRETVDTSMISVNMWGDNRRRFKTGITSDNFFEPEEDESYENDYSAAEESLNKYTYNEDQVKDINKTILKSLNRKK